MMTLTPAFHQIKCDATFYALPRQNNARNSTKLDDFYDLDDTYKRNISSRPLGMWALSLFETSNLAPISCHIRYSSLCRVLPSLEGGVYSFGCYCPHFGSSTLQSDARSMANCTFSQGKCTVYRPPGYVEGKASGRWGSGRWGSRGTPREGGGLLENRAGGSRGQRGRRGGASENRAMGCRSGRGWACGGSRWLSREHGWTYHDQAVKG